MTEGLKDTQTASSDWVSPNNKSKSRVSLLFHTTALWYITSESGTYRVCVCLTEAKGATLNPFGTKERCRCVLWAHAAEIIYRTGLECNE